MTESSYSVTLFPNKCNLSPRSIHSQGESSHLLPPLEKGDWSLDILSVNVLSPEGA
jgi:hypothetical protein